MAHACVNDAFRGTMMTKNETLVLKGIAIVFMLFYHLFYQIPNVSLCDYFITIVDIPFVHLLTRACNSVPFFLILGGYGMYTVYRKGDKNRFTRILKLYIHYWITLAIFLLVGFIVYGRTPGPSFTILSNITGFEATYNKEIWFLLPYALLSVTSSWLFSITDRFKTKYVLLLLLLSNLCTSFLISRYGNAFFYHNFWAYNPMLYFYLMFSFYLGAMTAKHQLITQISESKTGKLIKNYGWWLLLLLIGLRMLFRTGAFNAFYTYAFVVIFLNLKRSKIFDKSLAFLGQHSMNMWMIHSWFCYYLFKDFIYGFKYPVVIFLVLILVSILTSMIVNQICRPIEKLITKKQN